MRYAIECAFSWLNADGKDTLTPKEGMPHIFDDDRCQERACAHKDLHKHSAVYHATTIYPEGPLLDQRVAFARAGYGRKTL